MGEAKRGREEGEEGAGNGIAEVVGLVVDEIKKGAAGVPEREAMSDEFLPSRDKLLVRSGKQGACAACQSHAFAPAKNAWDDGAKVMSKSKEEESEPLLINLLR